MAPQSPIHVLIVGAGAAGLMAARELAGAGNKVTILESRDRCGGRIHPLSAQIFGYPAEGGAEFIHGAAPVTRALMREALLALSPVVGRRWSVGGGTVSPTEPAPHADRLHRALMELQIDLPVAEFLERHFADPQYSGLRHEIRRMVEGYDAADARKASTFALRDEWMGRGLGRPGRVAGGLEQMAENLRRQVAPLHAMLAAFGHVESVFFRGVAPGGYDIYGAEFANGLGEFRVRLDANGNIEDIGFRGDGDSTPGDILTCAQEQTLRAAGATVPIQLFIYNASGVDVRAFALDGDGKRSHTLMIGDDRPTSFLARVGQPWVFTDASGQCLEIIMPGQSTRYLTLPADARGQAVRPGPQRRSPMPGSEQALRDYIDALARGAPNYDDMTPLVATNTRLQLLLYRAVLARLGTLRAMSFRGVTAADNDVYIAHFGNGSAEWRLGLVKEGKIGRISLGPQFGPPY